MNVTWEELHAYNNHNYWLEELNIKLTILLLAL